MCSTAFKLVKEGVASITAASPQRQCRSFLLCGVRVFLKNISLGKASHRRLTTLQNHPLHHNSLAWPSGSQTEKKFNLNERLCCTGSSCICMLRDQIRLGTLLYGTDGRQPIVESEGPARQRRQYWMATFSVVLRCSLKILKQPTPSDNPTYLSFPSSTFITPILTVVNWNQRTVGGNAWKIDYRSIN